MGNIRKKYNAALKAKVALEENIDNRVLSFSKFSGRIVMKTPLSFWELLCFLSQFYQKGGLFSLKNPFKIKVF